jgi:hypothetical protein
MLWNCWAGSKHNVDLLCNQRCSLTVCKNQQNYFSQIFPFLYLPVAATSKHTFLRSTCAFGELHSSLFWIWIGVTATIMTIMKIGGAAGPTSNTVELLSRLKTQYRPALYPEVFTDGLQKPGWKPLAQIWHSVLFIQAWHCSFDLWEQCWVFEQFTEPSGIFVTMEISM